MDDPTVTVDDVRRMRNKILEALNQGRSSNASNDTSASIPPLQTSNQAQASDTMNRYPAASTPQLHQANSATEPIDIPKNKDTGSPLKMVSTNSSITFVGSSMDEGSPSELVSESPTERQRYSWNSKGKEKESEGTSLEIDMDIDASPGLTDVDQSNTVNQIQGDDTDVDENLGRGFDGLDLNPLDRKSATQDMQNWLTGTNDMGTVQPNLTAESSGTANGENNLLNQHSGNQSVPVEPAGTWEEKQYIALHSTYIKSYLKYEGLPIDLLWKIGAAGQKGEGMFATEVIPAKSLIYAECPVLSTKLASSFGGERGRRLSAKSKTLPAKQLEYINQLRGIAQVGGMGSLSFHPNETEHSMEAAFLMHSFLIEKKLPTSDSSHSVTFAIYRYLSKINHSCFPNARIFVPKVGDGIYDTYLEALADIKVGTEITIDYGDTNGIKSTLPYIESRYSFECKCGFPHATSQEYKALAKFAGFPPQSGTQNLQENSQSSANKDSETDIHNLKKRKRSMSTVL